MQRAREIILSYITSGIFPPLSCASPEGFVTFIQHLSVVLSGKNLISTECPRATWQLWKHTAFGSGVPKSVPTVVSRAGAITWTQSRTSQPCMGEFAPLSGQNPWSRTNHVWDESMRSSAYGTSSFLLGICGTEIWTQQGHSFSSLVLLQLEYVPRQLGFGSFLFTHFSGISISFPNQNLQGWNSRKEGEPWQFEISTSNEEAKGRMNAVCYNPRLPKTHRSSRIQAVTFSA